MFLLTLLGMSRTKPYVLKQLWGFKLKQVHFLGQTNAGGHLVTEEGLLIKTIVNVEEKKPPEATWSQKMGF